MVNTIAYIQGMPLSYWRTLCAAKGINFKTFYRRVKETGWDPMVALDMPTWARYIQNRTTITKDFHYWVKEGDHWIRKAEPQTFEIKTHLEGCFQE